MHLIVINYQIVTSEATLLNDALLDHVTTFTGHNLIICKYLHVTTNILKFQCTSDVIDF